MLFVIGPTASGKTALSIALARHFGGEIINADSRQFYRGMDIGTAKPTPQERAQAVHHLVDVADPDEIRGLAWFLDHAHAALQAIRARGGLPIVAGGTGQYVRALLDGWDVPRVPPDPAFRQALVGRAEREGAAALHAELATRDPAAAARIDHRNVRRVVRALEVASLRDRSEARPSARRDTLGRPLILGIHMERGVLYQRIDARVDAMFAAGLVEEVRSLNERGYGCDLPAFSAISYREVCGFLNDDLTLDEARSRTKTATHRLVRMQSAWFRRTDPRIVWLDAGADLADRAVIAVRRFLDEKE